MMSLPEGSTELRATRDETRSDQDGQRSPPFRIVGILAMTLLLLAVSPRLSAMEGDLQERAHAIVERIDGGDHFVTSAMITDLDKRARAAGGEARLELLYEALRKSAALRQADILLRCSERLRAEAEAQGNQRYLVLADAFRIFGQSMSGVLYDTLSELEDLLDEETIRTDWQVTAQIRVLIAAVAPPLGQFDSAIRHINAAFREVPQEGRMAMRLRADLHAALGTLDAQLRDIPGMLTEFERALDIAEANGWRLDGEALLYNLGNLFMREGDHESARETFGHLLAVSKRSGQAQNRFYALYGLMKVEHNAGNAEISNAYADQALAAMTPPPLFAAAIAQHRAFNLIALGHPEDAAREVEIAEKALEKGPDYGRTIYSAYNALLRSRLAELSGNYRDALTLYKKYAKESERLTRATFAEDVKSVRASLEGALQMEKAQRMLAESARAVAREEIRIQRLVLIALAFAGLAALAAFLHQRHMARELEASRRRAEAANLAKSQFLANISHELRTPLNAIIGFSEMCLREMAGPLPNAKYKGYAEAIHRSGRHLLAVINDILDLSRVEARRLELEEAEVAVADFVREAQELVAVHARDKAQLIEVDVPSTLPLVRVDARLMRQAIANLLSNAIKFSPAKSTVTVRAGLRDGGEIAITVGDRGIGMSESEIGVALEPFGQVQSVMTRGHEGTGLGLSLVKTFAELHGGRLEIRSAPGVGTRATIVLPQARVIVASPQTHAEPVASAARG